MDWLTASLMICVALSSNCPELELIPYRVSVNLFGSVSLENTSQLPFAQGYSYTGVSELLMFWNDVNVPATLLKRSTEKGLFALACTA